MPCSHPPRVALVQHSRPAASGGSQGGGTCQPRGRQLQSSPAAFWEGQLDGQLDGQPDAQPDGQLDGQLDGRPDGQPDGKPAAALESPCQWAAAYSLPAAQSGSYNGTHK